MAVAVNEPTLTRKSESLADQIIRLYESEADLLGFPRVMFETIGALVDADVVAHSEHHVASGAFRSVESVDGDRDRRARAMASYARHMHSHPFWQGDPEFFGTRALRESDFFDERAFLALPITREVFLPAGASHLIAIVLEHEGYVVRLTGYRVAGRAAFSDDDRDRLERFRPHASRAYRQAQERTVAALGPADRLRLAFPDLSPRQIEVASWLALGKTNEEIAAILSIGVHTVKTHVKAVLNKIGSESRLGVAVLAYTSAPFAALPPLWNLPLGVPPGETARVVG